MAEVVKDQTIENTESAEIDEEIEETDEYVESPERTEFRRKRVKRIKLILVLLLIIFLIIPNILCGILLYQLNKTNKDMEILREEIKISNEEIERKNREAAAAAQAQQEKEEKEAQYGVENLVQLNLTDEEKYPGKQLVYLTFDDGPSKYTNEILDILEEHDAKATFFVLAKEGFDDEYNRIIDDGHTLAMHSYTHKYSVIYASMENYREDIYSLSDFLTEKTGVKPKFYRFPGGSSNTISKIGIQDMLHFLGEEGIVHFDWNVSSEDAVPRMLEASTIVKNVVNGIGDKKESVVLMHDSAAKRSTVEALPIIIETLQMKGNVVFLPITDGTEQVYHVREKVSEKESETKETANEKTPVIQSNEIESEEMESDVTKAVEEAVSEAFSEEVAEALSEAEKLKEDAKSVETDNIESSDNEEDN